MDLLPLRGQQAEDLVAAAFKGAGWKVRRESRSEIDMVVRKRDLSYVVEVKSAAEGRSDRLVPLFAQACLQAAHAARNGRHAPLAVIAAPRIPLASAQQILSFAERYAPDAAVGIVDFEGLRLFRGPGLDGLNADAVRSASLSVVSKERRHLFSDLNQWMLKVILAPELPAHLLSAPRGRYRNASQLAEAAKVSVMSAFRFVQQLRDDGFVESSEQMQLVRREELFRNWRAAGLRSMPEVPMRFLIRGNADKQLGQILKSGRACLALFAAADALKLGFVDGVPPYVYVSRLKPANIAAWKSVVPAGPGEQPDLILRQAPAPESVFRGAVHPQGGASCDVLQIWLDVSAHPSRGREQADEIERRVLRPILKGQA